MDKFSDLFEKAFIYRNRAYAPYSDFFVGAALKSDNGCIYGGCNVENSSYPCGTCAEAGAISAMIAGGGKKITEILIVADSSSIVPCGNCLQKIREFADENTLIICADLQKNMRVYKIMDLLPQQFSAGDMNNA